MVAVAPVDEAEPLRQRLKWFLFCRVLVVSFFFGALTLIYLGKEQQRYTISVNLLLLAIAFTYAQTIVSAVFLLSLRRLRAFAYFQVGFDVLLTTGVILVTGGTDSPFGFLYSLPVINAAALLAAPGAFAAAATSAVAYASLIALLAAGWVARPAYPFPATPLDLQFALRFSTTNATFFLIAFLASSLVRRLHEAERLLAQREHERDRLAALHEALARNIGSALITTDVDGAVTSLNQTAEELIGCKTLQVIGKDVGAIFPPFRHTASGRLQFLQSSSTVLPTEFAYRTGDSRDLVLRCSAVMLRDTYRNPLGAVYIVQDISALRQLEDRLRNGAADVVEESAAADEGPPQEGLIGSSAAIGRVRDFIEKVARTDATLLITGESGTGKELLGRTVHARSARRDRPFIAVNCGAVPAELVESELFGHVKGAFTGAVTARAGLFRMADGGSIFLDEIGDLPLALQVKLLRVLQERSFTPVGADVSVTVDVRIIAATNRHLEEDVLAGRFREDLFYRLHVLTVEMPPLRERRQDIPQLIRRFLRQFADLHGARVERLSVAAARRLQEYDYPGNVRELENIIEHAVALCDGQTVHEPHLPDYVLNSSKTVDEQVYHGRVQAAAAGGAAAEVEREAGHPSIALPMANLEDDLAAYERNILLRALAEAGGVKKRAAELLGINYRSFRHRLQKHKLSESSPADPA